MKKRVILITGTPCVGKTTLATLLSMKLDAFYINLTELALKEKLVVQQDEERGSAVVDEVKMRRVLARLIEETDKFSVVVDGHYAASVVPKRFVSRIFVLRRDPRELRKNMKKCGFSEAKMRENLEAEILDVCLVEALRGNMKSAVCELDVTLKTVEQSLEETLAVLGNKKPCCFGQIDWLGTLESAGVLDDYLSI